MCVTKSLTEPCGIPDMGIEYEPLIATTTICNLLDRNDLANPL